MKAEEAGKKNKEEKPQDEPPSTDAILPNDKKKQEPEDSINNK